MNRLKSISRFVAVAAILSSCPCAFGEDHFFMHLFQRSKPQVQADPCVELVAKEIDYLEAMIETYGTVVPKHPDVWGEARLTKHRQEVEREMALDLGKFQETLNGSLRRSDQTYLSAALTISSATGEAKPVEINNDNKAEFADGEMVATSPIKGGTFGKAITEAEGTRISLEPTVVLEQKFRYLNLLNEIRRINEGDDTADSPGYSLNLVRIPVSILPGKKTQKGYGAEITVTAKSHLTEQLLPSTFRNLVINDVVDVLALPGRKVLDDEEFLKALKAYVRFKATGEWGDIEDKVIVRALNLNATQATELQTLLSNKQPVAQNEFELSGAEGTLEKSTSKNVLAMAEISDKYNDRLKSFVAATLTGSLATGRSSQSRTALSPLEVFDAYGETSLAVVASDAASAFESDPINSKAPHLADIETYLTWELNTAYDFLSRPEAQILWEYHCTPRLVEAIRQRRRTLPRAQYDRFARPINALEKMNPRIESLRDAFFADITKHFPRAAFSTTASLAWCIIVNSALLNDRLLDDMQKVSGETGSFYAPPKEAWPQFFLPQPTPDATALFNQYVETRWPIHVFALDPVTDEQNIAEVFSQRREMQLALAAGVASGNVNARTAMQFARRLELDLETIDLNRKAVAFAHGQNVFGWRFYPRFQSPDVPSTVESFVQTTLGIGMGDHALLNDRRLEPGMREVTAVVLMPSFVSHVSFDTRTNWFKLTNPRHKEMTLHDTMQISKAWQSIATRMPQINCPQNYRAEDVSWLVKSVEQIEYRLPLQSMLVPIPYENTLGGFEMFNSGITDLAPSLNGWYGAPGVTINCNDVTGCPCTTETQKATEIPPACVSHYGENQIAGTCYGTTLFLVGKNFSVHDTRVIAGGRAVPFQLLSRRIMQVTIPPNVNTLYETLANGGNRRVTDVHVATPYGVSNHMLIPTEDLDCPKPLPGAPMATNLTQPMLRQIEPTLYEADAPRRLPAVPNVLRR